MPVAPKFIAAWLWSWENSSCNTRREVEGWPEQESLCSVWSHHPIPAHQAILLIHPILILRFFSNGFTFILLSISSSHFSKHLGEFPSSNDAFCTFYRLINESTSYLPSWFTNCWIIPAILARMWRNQRAVFLFSLRQAWPAGQTGDNNSERSGYATQALAAHHHPAPDTTGFVYATTPSLRPDNRKGGGTQSLSRQYSLHYRTAAHQVLSMQQHHDTKIEKRRRERSPREDRFAGVQKSEYAVA